MRHKPHRDGHKKRAKRFAPYTPPKEVVLIKRAVFAKTQPRLTPSWMRSLNATTGDFL